MARSNNPVRFGLNPRNFPYEKLVSIAQAAEKAGFEVISFSDRPPENNLEGWTLATAIAVQTARINVTHSTLNIPLHHPAMLAKKAAALDIISGGRLILALGAGTQEDHSTTYGHHYGSAGERVDGLIDAITIVRGMLSEPSFTYQGKVYHVNDAVVEPKPVQQPIPIIIGAAKPRMLALTGRVADGWLRNGGWPADVGAYREQLEQVERGAEGAGRDPASLRRVLNCTAYVGTGDIATHTPKTFGNPGGLMGRPEDVLEIVEEYREAGVDTFHVQFLNDIVDEQIQAFGEQVIAKVR